MATLLPLGDSRGSSRGGVEWWYLPSDFPQLSLALEVLVSVAIESPSSLGVFCHVLFLHVVISFSQEKNTSGLIHGLAYSSVASFGL